MKSNQSLILYLIVFVIFSTLAKIFGFAVFDNGELLSVVLVAYGAGTVFAYMGSGKKVTLFIGTEAFLVGVLLYVRNNFFILNSNSMFLPAGLLIIGFGFLMLFIDTVNQKIFLWSSLVFLVSGIFQIFMVGKFEFVTFINSFYEILVKYWFIVFIAGVAIYLVIKDEK